MFKGITEDLSSLEHPPLPLREWLRILDNYDPVGAIAHTITYRMRKGMRDGLFKVNRIDQLRVHFVPGNDADELMGVYTRTLQNGGVQFKIKNRTVIVMR